MADRSGLQLLGFVFCGVTAAVMLMAAVVVYGHVGGQPALDQGQSMSAAAAPQAVQ
jgi:hypothetical protein